MGLIPGFPDELSLMANLRLTSTDLAVEGKLDLWQHLDLRNRKSMVQKFCTLLREPRLRRHVRTIQFPSSVYSGGETHADLDSWKTDIGACISACLADGALSPADIEILQICWVIDEDLSFPWYCSSPWDCPPRRRAVDGEGWVDPEDACSDASEAMAAAIALLCPAVSTLDFSNRYLPFSRNGKGHNLDHTWNDVIASGVTIPATTLRLDPEMCLSGIWNPNTKVHSMLRTPATRLDITGTSMPTYWSLKALEAPGVLEQLEDLRLDPEYRQQVASKQPLDKLSRKPSFEDQCEDQARIVRMEDSFAESIDSYSENRGERLRRLHFSYRSGALGWIKNSWARQAALLADISKLTNLVHLETDLVSLVNTPVALCDSPTALADLLPASLKKLYLSDVWCEDTKPCKHRASAYRRGLYNNLASLVKAQGTRFPNLESVVMEIPAEEDCEWLEELALGTRLCWARGSGTPGDDPFGVLKAGTSEKDAYFEFCQDCASDGSAGVEGEGFKVYARR